VAVSAGVKRYESLKRRQRLERPQFNTALALRVHRSLSWYHAAVLTEHDLDTQFITLWIAFNSAYAQNASNAISGSETATFKQFVGTLVDLDQQQRLYDLVWVEYPRTLRLILDNHYIFKHFWRYVQGECTEAIWKERFRTANVAARRAIEKQDTKKILSIVLSRLYVLRNQILHGGATWNGKTNRSQLRSATGFLLSLMPCVIDILMEFPQHPWPTPLFPVIDE